MSGFMQGMSMGMKAGGAISAGGIAETQGKFTKQIAMRNRDALERQRKAELDAAAVGEQRVSIKGKVVMALQRAIISKTGIGLAGATLSLLADTAFQFAMDRNLILRRGLIRGQELRERGQIQYAIGAFAKTLGKKARHMSYALAGGSIASGSVGTSILGGGGGTQPTQATGAASAQYGGYQTGQYSASGGAFGR